MNEYVVPNNFDVIYTMAKTPCFISANQNDVCGSTKPNYYTGACAPPTDVTCSGQGVGGTGGDDGHFISFMTDLWTHIVNEGWTTQKDGVTPRQWYFELWNEPDRNGMWDNDWITKTYCFGDVNANTGPQRILMRMAADAQNAVGTHPNVHFLTPPMNMTITAVQQGGWWYQYLSLGGGAYADIMSNHGYLQNNPVEAVCCAAGTLVANTLATMKQFNQSGKPLLLTETSCGDHCPTGDPALAGWAGRYYTLVLSQSQVASLEWYAYDAMQELWNGSTLTATGTAVGVMQTDWRYDGATFDAAGCAEVRCGSGHRWTCNLTEGSGTQAQVAWFDGTDTSCSYGPSSPPYIDYQDLTGKSKVYQGSRLR
jgi:hypothetical protein